MSNSPGSPHQSNRAWSRSCSSSLGISPPHIHDSMVQLETPPAKLSLGSVGNWGRDEAGLDSPNLGTHGDMTSVQPTPSCIPTHCSQSSHPVFSGSTGLCAGFGGICGHNSGRAVSGARRKVIEGYPWQPAWNYNWSDSPLWAREGVPSSGFS